MGPSLKSCLKSPRSSECHFGSFQKPCPGGSWAHSLRKARFWHVGCTGIVATFSLPTIWPVNPWPSRRQTNAPISVELTATQSKRWFIRSSNHSQNGSSPGSQFPTMVLRAINSQKPFWEGQVAQSHRPFHPHFPFLFFVRVDPCKPTLEEQLICNRAGLKEPVCVVAYSVFALGRVWRLASVCLCLWGMARSEGSAVSWPLVGLFIRVPSKSAREPNLTILVKEPPCFCDARS